jgi:sec-independent protein translocase protein TatA
MELVIVLVLALVILGPKRLPEAGKAVGKGMREFKESIAGRSSEEDEAPAAIPASARAE